MATDDPLWDWEAVRSGDVARVEEVLETESFDSYSQAALRTASENGNCRMAELFWTRALTWTC